MNKISLTLLAILLSVNLLFSQQITTVSPGTATRGQTLQVSISGQNTFFTQTSTTSWLTRGVDAIVPSINSIQSMTQMSSIYSIPSNAGLGYWDMHVMDAVAGEILKLDAILILSSVGVDPRGSSVKESIQLGPNPAVDQFRLKYDLPTKSMVQVQIRDMRGNLLKPLFVGEQAPGTHDLEVNLNELHLPAGIYLVTLQVDDMFFATKTTFLK